MDGKANEDRLFLAAVPDTATADRIAGMARRLKYAYGFTGKLTPPDRLHVSLFFLGGLPDDMVRAACAGLSDVRAPPFEIVFDRGVSFRSRASCRPFVLVGDDGPSRLKSFRQMLSEALIRKGLRRRASTSFTPHITLLYDVRGVDEHPVAPITWSVRDFVLIRSEQGHTHLMRWPLRV
jgi:RNA 2',3'-cyclic 3'-phosphodiesterase